MFEILYSSHALVQLTPNDMEILIGASRERNAADDITGSLLSIHDPDGAPGFYVQVLEGPVDTVKATYERIRHDSLHTTITTLHARVTPGRAFRDWSMRLEAITSEQARMAGGQLDPTMDLGVLLRKPDFARRLIAAFRTVTATAGTRH